MYEGIRFTIKSSGREVLLNQVSQFTVKDYLALWGAKPENRRPQAPQQNVKGQLVTNTADPDYRAELQAWEVRREVAAGEALLILGIEVEIDHVAVQRVRDRYRRLFGQDLPGDDHTIMVLHVCILNELDTYELQLIIQGKSTPEPDEVDSEVAGFQDNMESDANRADGIDAASGEAIALD